MLPLLYNFSFEDLLPVLVIIAVVYLLKIGIFTTLFQAIKKLVEKVRNKKDADT